MNGFAFPVTVNGRPQEPMDLGGRPANLFTPWMVEHLVQTLGRLADGGDYRASFADGVLRVVTPSGNRAEMVVPLPVESFDGAGLTSLFYEGSRDLLRSRFVHAKDVRPDRTYHHPTLGVPTPAESFISLTVHNAEAISIRSVIADAAGALGVRHRGARPTTDTLAAVASEFVVDLREAERVFIRSAKSDGQQPVVFDWRRSISTDEISGLQVEV